MNITAYVCSSYSSKDKYIFEEQLKWTKKISRTLVLNQVDVITPHLYYTQFLYDGLPLERKAGMESALRLIEKCDAVFVSVAKHISQGMEAEIDRAEELGINIYYFKTLDELKAKIWEAKLDLSQETTK